LPGLNGAAGATGPQGLPGAAGTAFPHADISLVKTAHPATVAPEGIIDYTLTVSNAGPAKAFGTVLEDFPPNELCRLIYSTDGGLNWRPWRGYLRLGSLEPKSSVTVLISGMVRRCARGSVVNLAEAFSSTADIHPENNRSEVTVEIMPR
jgi:uncharacterized repeat protein (TIGR01451 family)